MLPSTGYFKTINCPFYDSGLCERPYCHFRHVRKEATETQVASSAATSKEEKSQDESPADHPTDESLNKLVSEAVKRVLQQQQEIMTGSVVAPTLEAVVPDSIVNQVVAELKPAIAQRVPPLAEASSAKSAHKAYLPPVGIPQYKPTPISELRKRHIPVPYTPLPAPRGTSKVQVKHPSSKDDIARKKFKSETIVKDSKRERTDSHDSEEPPAKKPSYLYSPSPIATSHNGWGAANKSISYVPSSIDGLSTGSSDYVPSSLALPYSIPEYCPSEKSSSSTEPQYYPFDKSNSTSTVEVNYVPGRSENDHIDVEYKPDGSSETVQMSVEYKPTVKSELVEEYNSNDKTNFTGLEDLDLSFELNILEKILDENSNDSINDSLDSKTETENKKIESSKLLETLPESEMERIHDTKCVETTNKVKVESETKIKPKDSSSHSKSHTRPSSSSKKKEREKKLEKSETVKHSKGNHKNSKKKHENKHSILKSERVKLSSSSGRKDGTERKSNDRHRSHRHHSSSNLSEHSHRHSSSDTDTVTKDKHSHSSSSHSSTKSHRERSRSSSKSHRERSRSSSKSHRERSRSSSGANKSQDNHRNHHKASGHGNSRKDRKLRSKSSTKISKERKSKKQARRSPSPTSDFDDSGQSDSASSLSTVCEESETEVIPAESPEHGEITDSEADEDTITKECYRIFQEYEPQPKPLPIKILKLEETVKEEDVVLAKKRIAHEGAQYHPPQIAAPSKHIPNPILTMHARIARLRAMNERKAEGDIPSFPSTSYTANASASSSCVSSNSGASSSTGRVRIAHVPNVSMILSAKTQMEEFLQRRKQNLAKNNANPPETTEKQNDCKTVVQTIAKGMQRIARRPNITVLKQTPLLEDYGGNIPVTIREIYLNHLIIEYEKLYQDSEEASIKAKEEELLICERSTTRTAYSSNMSNLVGRLRKEAQQGASSSSVAHPQMARMVSHSAILAGHSGSKGRGSWSIVRHNKTSNDKSAENTFYNQMLQFLLTEDQLINNGYPRPHPEEKGMAIIKLQRAYTKKPQLNSLQRKVMRSCCRCDATYSVDKHGIQLKEEPCIFHWGKIFNQRVRGMWDRRYTCCSADFGAEGCTVNSYHVHDDIDPDNLKGFVKTLPSHVEPPNGDYGVFALDCEMSYTTHGVELTRVTVIDKDLNTVYETLVKPENPIIDFNTRYSGITKEMMKDVKTTIYEVQASLLALFHEKTILLGHSLENDLKALKIIHNMVVDTSIVFPHRQGPPKKRALKNLCRDYLNKLIQEGEEGHDSAEDARACMELMKWRLNMT